MPCIEKGSLPDPGGGAVLQCVRISVYFIREHCLMMYSCGKCKAF